MPAISKNTAPNAFMWSAPSITNIVATINPTPADSLFLKTQALEITPKREPNIAKRPKNVAWAWDALKRNIKTDPERTPIREPIRPIAISKCRVVTLVLFMIIY